MFFCQILAWKQGVGFIDNRTVAQHTRKPQDESVQRKIRVEPFVMIKKDCDAAACVGNDRFEGYCVGMLSQLLTTGKIYANF